MDRRRQQRCAAGASLHNHELSDRGLGPTCTRASPGYPAPARLACVAADLSASDPIRGVRLVAHTAEAPGNAAGEPTDTRRFPLARPDLPGPSGTVPRRATDGRPD